MASVAEIAGESVTERVAALARAGREAQRSLAAMGSDERAAALRLAATALRDAEATMLAANAEDCSAAEAYGLSAAMLDRLKLDPARVAGMADAVAAVAELPDPVGV